VGIIQGLAPGSHTILIHLANATHQPIDQATVDVTVPDVALDGRQRRASDADASGVDVRGI